ncbi:MAG: CalY family protein [Acidimicrobiia bacterium]|nr:CalY family protein [Acidimicrobiia bacterium]
MTEQTRNRPVAPQVLATIAVVALTVAALAAVSLAVYTDNESVANNTISSGTIDLTATPATAAISMTAITPGDQVTAPMTIGNAGDVALRYAMTSTTTEDTFASSLTFTVKSGVATCTDAGFGASGTVEYTGILGSTATSAILGNVAQGNQAGDRSLAPATNEVLCLNVRLPAASGNISQGQTTSATLTFAAEQTANNP